MPINRRIYRNNSNFSAETCSDNSGDTEERSEKALLGLRLNLRMILSRRQGEMTGEQRI